MLQKINKEKEKLPPDTLSVPVYSCNSRCLYKIKQAFITNTVSVQHE